MSGYRSGHPLDLLQVNEAARLAGMSPDDLHQLVDAHRIRFRRVDGRLLFERGEILRTAQRLAAESAEMVEVSL